LSPAIFSRLAPTPSGYLHLGNLANFLLVEKLVKDSGGRLFLRIDDCDGTRARREFVEHIFETLRWLGIEWQEGPRDAESFYRGFSQVSRKVFYFEKLKPLSPFTFACACSRKELAGEGCRCREEKIAFEPGKTALRLRFEDPALWGRFGDVVLWRKDDGPAYHWASVVDDLEWGVNLIVRGEDLRESSELQGRIAALVRPGGFEGARFVHHPLLVGEAGEELSKSQGALSVVELRKAGMGAEAVRGRVEALTRDWRLDT
jgi:glutamyl-tRNA synthetase